MDSGLDAVMPVWGQAMAAIGFVLAGGLYWTWNSLRGNGDKEPKMIASRSDFMNSIERDMHDQKEVLLAIRDAAVSIAATNAKIAAFMDDDREVARIEEAVARAERKRKRAAEEAADNEPGR